MPTIHIDMVAGKPPQYCAALRDTIIETLRHVLGVTGEACHEVVTEHGDEYVDTAWNCAGMHHTGDAMLVRITLEEGPTLEQRRVLYTAIVEALQQRVMLQARDIAIKVLSAQKENWHADNPTGPLQTPPSTSATTAPVGAPPADEIPDSHATNGPDCSPRGRVHGAAGFHRGCNSRAFRS
jgi:4-oxalocrotonate tautomerase